MTTPSLTLADALADGMVLYEHLSPAQGWAVVTDPARVEQLVSLATGGPCAQTREEVETDLLAGRTVRYGADCWYLEIALRRPRGAAAVRAAAPTPRRHVCRRCGGPVSDGRAYCGEC